MGSGHCGEEGFGGFAAHHAFGDRVGLALILVAVAVDSTRGPLATELLHYVSGFVGGGKQIGCPTKRHSTVCGVGLGAHRFARLGHGIAKVCPDK